MCDSPLGGVPIEGTASFVNTDGRARPAVDITAAGNRASGRGQLGGAGSAADDWRLASTHPCSTARGLVRATVRAPPCWPALAVGHDGISKAVGHPAQRWRAARQAACATGPTRCAAPSGRWRMGSAARCTARRRSRARRRRRRRGARSMHAGRLSGSARAHRGELRVASAVLPPAWTDASSCGRRRGVQRPAGAGAAGPHLRRQERPCLRGARPSAARRAPPRRLAQRCARRPRAASSTPAAARRRLARQLREIVARCTAEPTRPGCTRAICAARALGRRAAHAPSSRASRRRSAPPCAGAGSRGRRRQRGAPGPARRAGHLEPMAVAPLLRSAAARFRLGRRPGGGRTLDVAQRARRRRRLVVERAGGDLTVTDESVRRTRSASPTCASASPRRGTWHFTPASRARLRRRSPARRRAHAPQCVVAGRRRRRSMASSSCRSPTSAPGARGCRRAGASTASCTRARASGAASARRVHRPHRRHGDRGAQLAAGRRHQRRRTRDRAARRHRAHRDASPPRAATARAARRRRQLRRSADGTAALPRRPLPAARPGRPTHRHERPGGAATGRQHVALDGAFKVDEGLVDFTRSDAPTLGDDVEVVRRPARAGASRAASRGAGAADPSWRAATAPGRARPARRHGRAAARARPRARRRVARRAAPDLAGRAACGQRHAAHRRRHLPAYGQKLDIDRGMLVFAGPVENPRLDIEATRPEPRRPRRRGGHRHRAHAARAAVLGARHERHRQAELAGPRPRSASRRRTRRCCKVRRWRCSRARAPGATDRLLNRSASTRSRCARARAK